MKRPVAALVFGCASVLLSYPDADFVEDLAAVEGALDRLPKSRARIGLYSTQQWLAGMSLVEAAACYVDTFDLQKRHSLHLTYYRHGDTRERGMALSSLVDLYRNVGLALSRGELPDFLPALLELAAVSSVGAAVLGEHRPALEVLRSALEKGENPYSGVVSSVIEALGAMSKYDRAAIQRYRSQGPPSERVGLEPFAPPEVVGQRVVIR